MLSCAKPFSALGGQTAHQGRGAADRDEYREVAGAGAEALLDLNQRRSINSDVCSPMARPDEEPRSSEPPAGAPLIFHRGAKDCQQYRQWRWWG